MNHWFILAAVFFACDVNLIYRIFGGFFVAGLAIINYSFSTLWFTSLVLFAVLRMWKYIHSSDIMLSGKYTEIYQQGINRYNDVYEHAKHGDVQVAMNAAVFFIGASISVVVLRDVFHTFQS